MATKWLVRLTLALSNPQAGGNVHLLDAVHALRMEGAAAELPAARVPRVQ